MAKTPLRGKNLSVLYSILCKFKKRDYVGKTENWKRQKESIKIKCDWHRQILRKKIWDCRGENEFRGWWTCAAYGDLRKWHKLGRVKNNFVFLNTILIPGPIWFRKPFFLGGGQQRGAYSWRIYRATCEPIWFRKLFWAHLLGGGLSVGALSRIFTVVSYLF